MKYTVTLKTLIDNDFDIGLQDYPIFDENKRLELNNYIKSYFEDYEIGFETPAKFKRALNRKMIEIMPYYNQLFESELLEFDVFKNVDMETIHTLIDNSDYSSETKDESKVNANNQQNVTTSQTNGGDSKNYDYGNSEIDNPNTLKYFTVGTTSKNTVSESQSNKNDSTSSSTSNSSNKGKNVKKQEYTERVRGASASGLPSDMLVAYRKTFLNIKQQICFELEDCFLQVY